jgi:hypothetical protein
MKPNPDALMVLKGKLDFVNRGGYRSLVGRRQPLFCMETGAAWKRPAFFGGYPSCPKEHYCPLRYRGRFACFWTRFRRANEAAPCHPIPLNGEGETIARLEQSGDRTKVEAALKTWLEKNIAQFEYALHADV